MRTNTQRSSAPEAFLMNTDKEPSIPEGYSLVYPCQRYGKINWTSDSSELFQDLVQEMGHGDGITVRIMGSRLYERVKRKRVMNATMLDYLMRNKRLIPKSWKKNKAGETIRIYFWGSLFRDPHGVLWVKFLFWDKDDGKWDWSMSSLSSNFHDSNSYAAVLK